MEQFELDTRLGQLRYPYATTSKILDFCVVGRGAPVEPIRRSGGSSAKTAIEGGAMALLSMQLGNIRGAEAPRRPPYPSGDDLWVPMLAEPWCLRWMEQSIRSYRVLIASTRVRPR
jgi:hypothetical protein